VVAASIAAPALGLRDANSPARFHIAFVRSDRVYFMNADGSGQRDAGLPASPLWTRDGQRMSYVGADRHLYVADGNGRNRHRIVRGWGGSDFARDWSPGGRKLAYQDEWEVDFASIWVINADGSGQKRLTKTWNLDPKWSPDGRTILHVGHQKQAWQLFVMNADGGSRHSLGVNADANEGSGAWSPDGKRIFFLNRQKLYVVGSRGGRVRELSSGLKVGAFAVSPDGRAVAFQAAKGSRDWEIYRVGAGGKALRQLTDNRLIGDVGPAWSPDGSKILFTTGRDGRAQVYLMNADGTHPTNLSRSRTDDVDARWVPTF
jgi:Tol biopolymer transport system component